LELNKYPHVNITADVPWYPLTLDNEFEELKGGSVDLNKNEPNAYGIMNLWNLLKSFGRAMHMMHEGCAFLRGVTKGRLRHTLMGILILS
jgi:hypothetical protein